MKSPILYVFPNIVTKYHYGRTFSGDHLDGFDLTHAHMLEFVQGFLDTQFLVDAMDANGGAIGTISNHHSHHHHHHQI